MLKQLLLWLRRAVAMSAAASTHLPTPVNGGSTYLAATPRRPRSTSRVLREGLAHAGATFSEVRRANTWGAFAIVTVVGALRMSSLRTPSRRRWPGDWVADHDWRTVVRSSAEPRESVGSGLQSSSSDPAADASWRRLALVPMNQSVYTVGLAIGVFQLARSLPSPYKEGLLFVICVGALAGGALAERLGKPVEEGPQPPPRWERWQSRESLGEPSKADGDTPQERTAPGPDVLKLPPAAGHGLGPKLGIAIVPGNPGIPHFYCKFGEQLQQELAESGLSDVSVYVVGYPNFVTGASAAAARSACGTSAIEEEAARIGDVLSQLGRLHHVDGQPGLIAVGHSIGAWVVLQHLLQTGASARDIQLAFLAMPYLQFAPSATQARYRQIMGLPGFNSVLYFLALLPVMLPDSLKDWLATKLVREAEADQLEIVKATFLRQPHHTIAMAQMGRTEFLRLDAAVVPEGGLQEFAPLVGVAERPPLLALYTDNDHWAPRAHAQKLQELFDDAKARRKGGEKPCDEVLHIDLPEVLLGETSATGIKSGLPTSPAPHGFVLSPPHSAAIARLMSRRIVSSRDH